MQGGPRVSQTARAIDVPALQSKWRVDGEEEYVRSDVRKRKKIATRLGVVVHHRAVLPSSLVRHYGSSHAVLTVCPCAFMKPGVIFRQCIRLLVTVFRRA